MKRRISKTSKRRLVIFGSLSLIAIVYGFFTVSYYGISLLKVNTENKKLQNELKLLQNDEENLRIEIQKLKDPEYVARYARENYLYSKDGEYIIKLDVKEETKEEEVIQSTNNMYIIIVGICVAVILIVLFRKKDKTVE